MSSIAAFPIYLASANRIDKVVDFIYYTLQGYNELKSHFTDNQINLYANLFLPWIVPASLVYLFYKVHIKYYNNMLNDILKKGGRNISLKENAYFLLKRINSF